MITFLILYVLGYFASLAMIYVLNRREFSADKTDLDVALLLSVFSWLTVIVKLIIMVSGSDWFWRLNKRFKDE